MTRICIVGGGSAYMPGIAFALARHRAAFPAATITLHDVDADALELQARLTRSILRSRGAHDVTVIATLDRRAALDGADVVLAAFRPGGLRARHLDEAIPVRYGVIGQETAGPGGFAMALRSVPVVLGIAEEMREVAAPDAMFLDYTNPVQIVSEAMAHHAPDVPFIGLCDQTRGEADFLGRLLGVDAGRIELDTRGTNHMTFTERVRVAGREVTDELWAMLDELDLRTLVDETERRVVRLFRVLRNVPSEYLQYFFFHEEVLVEQRAAGRTRAEEIMALLPEVIESYRREADEPDPHPSMARASEEHGDFAVSLMATMLGGERGRFVLNVPNEGQVPNLDTGAVVETPCEVEGRGVRPIAGSPIPPEAAGTVAQVVEHARLTAEAALLGDRGLAVRALLAHPLVRSLGVAERMVDEFLAAHAEHLPRFHRPRRVP